MHVELPRAVPLVYYLDENLRPMPLAGSAPHISGEYVGNPEEVRGGGEGTHMDIWMDGCSGC